MGPTFHTSLQSFLTQDPLPPRGYPEPKQGFCPKGCQKERREDPRAPEWKHSEEGGFLSPCLHGKESILLAKTLFFEVDQEFKKKNPK